MKKLILRSSMKNIKSLFFNLALNYSANKEDAEEITQDIFVTIFKKLESFRYESKIEWDLSVKTIIFEWSWFFMSSAIWFIFGIGKN